MSGKIAYVRARAGQVARRGIKYVSTPTRRFSPATERFVPQSAGESIGVDLLSAKRVRLVVSSPAVEFVVDSAALIDIV